MQTHLEYDLLEKTKLDLDTNTPFDLSFVYMGHMLNDRLYIDPRPTQ